MATAQLKKLIINVKKNWLIIFYLVYIISFSLLLDDFMSAYGRNGTSILHVSVILIMFLFFILWIISTGLTLLIFLLSFFVRKAGVYRFKMIKIALVLFLLFFPPLCGSNVLGAYVVKINEAFGLSIVEALEKYNKDFGAYPDNLTFLTPKYLPQIPKTSKGKDFEYVKSNSSYRLYFLEYWARYEYTSETKRWIYHD